MTYEEKVLAGIRIEMEAKRYTVAALAKEMGVNRKTLWGKLNGLSRMNIGEMDAIAKALGRKDALALQMTAISHVK